MAIVDVSACAAGLELMLMMIDENVVLFWKSLSVCFFIVFVLSVQPSFIGCM